MALDPDVPLLQRMRRDLAREVARGGMKPGEALAFLQQYADVLARTPLARKRRLVLEALA